MLQQNTNQILMVRPACFGFNTETAENNAFQRKDQSRSRKKIHKKALKEFDRFVYQLRQAGIKVTVVQDSKKPKTPDAIFPNNWISMHSNGSLFTYPMYAPNRRMERQQYILDQIGAKFEIIKKYDLSKYEDYDIFLEGTGSMIFDHQHKLVYACLSPRTDESLLYRFASLIEYKKIVFDACDQKEQAIYHTNVMMAMGATFVVICMDSIRDKKQSKKLQKKFVQTKKEVIEISIEQMNAFAGNMLQVENSNGEKILVMSSQAYSSLSKKQINKIKKHTKILQAPIDTIEKNGGGSVRCMMAEVFLKPKK